MKFLHKLRSFLDGFSCPAFGRLADVMPTAPEPVLGDCTVTTVYEGFTNKEAPVFNKRLLLLVRDAIPAIPAIPANKIICK